MVNHSSATAREETPHAIKSTNSLTNSKKTRNLNGTTKSTKSKTLNLSGAAKSNQQQALNLNGRSKTTISNALKRRAQAVINDRSIDAQSRALIRYGLETNDPLLPELVRRLEAGETIIETIVLLKHPKPAPRIRTGKRSKH